MGFYSRKKQEAGSRNQKPSFYRRIQRQNGLEKLKPFHGTGALIRIIHEGSSRGGADAHGCKAHLAVFQPARWEDSAGVLDSTERNTTERNAADMPGSTAAAEAS